MSSGSRAAESGDGVRLVGVGSAFPKREVTNADLEKLMDTSDEWIVQRTGISKRFVSDHDSKEETTSALATRAVKLALEDAKVCPSELDLVIVATITPDMPTPSVACQVIDAIGAGNIVGFDLSAACCGFVFSINVAHDMLRAGSYRKVAVIGADCVTRHVEYSTHGRASAILFGDAAGAMILEKTEDASKGVIAQAMHTDGERAKHLLIPCHERDFPEGVEHDARDYSRISMNGHAVFRFAVSTFPELIQETLDKAGLRADDIDHYICHQSNSRILSAARDRFGLPQEKMLVNIDRVGNTVAASMPLIFDELKSAGRFHEGQRVMFLGFGAGLTWGSSLWQL